MLTQGCDSGQPFLHCPGQTDTEYQSEFSLWCLAGSSLLVATDIRNMTATMTKVLLNTEVIAVNQDKNGKGGQRIGTWPCSEGAEYCQIWGKLLHDGSYAVGLYNAGLHTHHITLNFKLLGFSGTVTMRDLWAHKDLGTFTNNYTAEVVSHGVEVYKVIQLQ